MPGLKFCQTVSLPKHSLPGTTARGCRSDLRLSAMPLRRTPSKIVISHPFSKRKPECQTRCPCSAKATAVNEDFEHVFRVSQRMQELKKAGRKALIPFIMAGDPNLDATAKAMKILDAEGADVIELGIPYSDPLADGPTIHAAATRALLEQGTTLDKVLDMLSGLKESISTPVVLFCYYNPMMRRGLEKFCRQAKEAGASGLLVPDIPLEETPEIKRVAREHGIELVLLTTPTTRKERMRLIAEATSGFLYLVSVTGVTGARTEVGARVGDLISTLKSLTDKPVAVGFGVSKPEHAAEIVRMNADGVICGSALVKALGEAESPEAGLAAMTELFRGLRAATP